MHSETDRAWLDAPNEAHLHNASLATKTYVDDGYGGADGPLPGWVAEVLDGDGPLDLPTEGGTVLARFVRDLPPAITDDAERGRVLRAALLAAAGRLGDGER
jgi:hypothetical protein